jgi:hypothetical protein
LGHNQLDILALQALVINLLTIILLLLLGSLRDRLTLLLSKILEILLDVKSLLGA